MLAKLLLSILIATVIVFIIQLLQFRITTKRINKINKNILQSAMMYFVRKDLDKTELDKFYAFLQSRLRDINMINHVDNLKIDILNNRIVVAYECKTFDYHTKEIAYEIKKSSAAA